MKAFFSMKAIFIFSPRPGGTLVAHEVQYLQLIDNNAAGISYASIILSKFHHFTSLVSSFAVEYFSVAAVL
jgi:hypothetical protein